LTSEAFDVEDLMGCMLCVINDTPGLKAPIRSPESSQHWRMAQTRTRYSVLACNWPWEKLVSEPL
jgi:hypothetical protein